MGNRAKCCNCGRPIFRPGAGSTWLHVATASAACHPGLGGRKASPVEVNANP